MCTHLLCLQYFDVLVFEPNFWGKKFALPGLRKISFTFSRCQYFLPIFFKFLFTVAQLNFVYEFIMPSKLWRFSYQTNFLKKLSSLDLWNFCSHFCDVNTNNLTPDIFKTSIKRSSMKFCARIYYAFNTLTF